MKTKDLRSMSQADLKSKLIELRKELIKHNAQIATGTTPKSPGQVREIKKTIAKILTIVGSKTEKESEATSTPPEKPKETAKPAKESKAKEKKKATQKKSEEE